MLNCWWQGDEMWWLVSTSTIHTFSCIWNNHKVGIMFNIHIFLTSEIITERMFRWLLVTEDGDGLDGGDEMRWWEVSRKMYHRRNIIWMSACVKVATSGELRTPPISLNNFSQQKLSTDPGGRTWGSGAHSTNRSIHTTNTLITFSLYLVLVMSRLRQQKACI